MPTTKEYGFWRCPVDVSDLFAKPSSPQFLEYRAGSCFWVESRADEGGRTVVVRRDGTGKETTLTPAEFNVRTRVHEYGGKCFTVGERSLYFFNDGDRKLYEQRLDSPNEPAALTHGDAECYGLSDLCLTPSGLSLLAVMELAIPGREHQNHLAALSLGGTVARFNVLAGGADFVANPTVSPDGKTLAWIEWDHPNMPWDRSRLMVGSVNETERGLKLENIRRVIDEDGCSVCQLRFYSHGLVFALDRDGGGECDNFWNLYRWDGLDVERLSCDHGEYGSPHWIFGERNHAEVDGMIVSKCTAAQGDKLVLASVDGSAAEPLESEYCGYAHFSEAGQQVMAMASSTTRLPELVSINRHGVSTLRSAPDLFDQADISAPVAVRFPTRDGATAHGFYYPPKNSAFRGPEGSIPPLIVMVHGGPTARANNGLDYAKQYWTSAGFSILDVNHRGSTGFGRGYRQHLLGRWGAVEIDDVVNGIDYLAEEAMVDRKKVFIRGKSAGGYTVLLALTRYPEVFSGGSCYYGIGDLATLAEHTHKFESRYTDRLIGETFTTRSASDPESRYYQRSPIHYIGAINSPIILFQGADDRVVPPELSRQVARSLSDRGIEHEYVEYAGEGHGFRSADTLVDAINKETKFFRNILGAEIR